MAHRFTHPDAPAASHQGEQRKLTELDFNRLERFTVRGARPELESVLKQAVVVPGPRIPADVVTMYSRFVVRDLQTQARRILVVCHPADAEPAGGYISVLSPAGLGLIGHAVGAVATWPGAAGTHESVRIEEMLFQPEATGDYVT